MTNEELAKLAYDMATDVYGYSKYRKYDTAVNYGADYNVGKWEDNRWHSDCLGFVHIAVNGFKGDRSKVGGGAVMDDFVWMSDEWTTLNKYCSIRGQFPKTDLKKGALLQNSGHVGLYIGEVVWNGITYNTAECTLALRKGWLLTWTDLETGYRYSYKGGIRLSSGWQNWGYFDRIDYKGDDEDMTYPEKCFLEAGAKDIILEKGSKDKALVEFIQKYFQYWGWYDGDIDGDFGEYTEKAIKAWQKHDGFEVTGKIAEKEWLHIFKG